MKSATPFVLGNTVMLLVVLAMNYLANALPIAGVTPAQVSDMFPTLFTPAGFTFAIWGVIYLLLIGFAIYQIKFLGKEVPLFLQKIGWLFVLSCAANAGWLLAFHHLQMGLSMLVMLVLLGSLLAIYLRLETEGRAQFWLVRLPFSVYLGWICVATIANASILLSHLGWNGEPGGPQLWTVAVIAAAVAIGLLALLKRRDFGLAFVIVWALFGIYSKRIADVGNQDGMVEVAALAGMVATVLGIIYRFIKRSYTR